MLLIVEPLLVPAINVTLSFTSLLPPSEVFSRGSMTEEAISYLVAAMTVLNADLPEEAALEEPILNFSHPRPRPPRAPFT